MDGTQRVDQENQVPIPAYLPHRGVAKFVGRGKKMTELHQMLQQGDRSAVYAAIVGMGGIGKTELALQYALDYKRTYAGGICWLQARREDVDNQLVRFGKSYFDLNPPEGMELADQVKYCWRKWQAGEVLLVFDDVTDYKALKPYFPPPTEPRFKVLMTTRQRSWPSVKYLELDVLDEAAALELLKSLVEGERIESQLDDAKQLCEQLGYLPLGLELVGRYLASIAKLSVAELMERLSKSQLEAKALCQTHQDMTAQLGVAAAFELSWKTLSPDAQQLGCGLSLFAAAPIPWSLVEQCFAEPDPEDLEQWLYGQLLKLHLLQEVASTYQLHPLIREFMIKKQENLDNADDQKNNYFTAMVKEAKKIPETPTLQEITKLNPVVPHLIEAANNYKTHFRSSSTRDSNSFLETYKISLSDKDLIWFFYNLGQFYQGQGLYAQALPWKEQCLLVARERLGEQDLDVATICISLAKLYNSQERYDEAENLYQKALEIRRHLLGEQDLDVAIIYNNLGFLYNSKGDYTEAERYYKKALELKKHLLGEEHPDLATSYNNLAVLYGFLKRFKEAEEFYQKALELKKPLLGREDLFVANIYNNLGSLYNSLERFNEAEEFYQKALEIKKHLLGEEHLAVATIYDNLGFLYNSQRRPSDAEQNYQKALELKKRVLGEEDIAVATSYNNLANFYDSQGRDTEAEQNYQKALALTELSLGVNNPRTIAIREKLKFS